MRSRMKYVRVDAGVYEALLRARNCFGAASVHRVLDLLLRGYRAGVAVEPEGHPLEARWLCVGERVYEGLRARRDELGLRSMRAAVRGLVGDGRGTGA